MSASKGASVLVTGGAGYIGTTLVPYLLREGYRVRVLDNLLHGGKGLLGCWSAPGFEFMRGDVRKPSEVREALEGMTSVVHLAAIVGDPACAREPAVALEVNQTASLMLLEESRKAGVDRFLFASTCSNYGRMADPESYVDENSALAPVSLYAETKVAVEKAAMSASGDRFCPVLLRFATVFGISPRMRFDLTVNEFAMELLDTRRLTVFGEQFWRPYIHVRDLAAAVHLVLAAPSESVKGHVFNVGSTRENYRKQQIVELIQQYAPDADIRYVHRAEDPRDYRVCFTKIQQSLGFVPQWGVPDGVAELVSLYDSGTVADWRGAEYRN